MSICKTKSSSQERESSDSRKVVRGIEHLERNVSASRIALRCDVQRTRAAVDGLRSDRQSTVSFLFTLRIKIKMDFYGTALVHIEMPRTVLWI